MFVGVGMVPRGEVGIIVAGLGLASGVVPRPLYGVIIEMAIVTTLIVPPMLKRLAPPAVVDGPPAFGDDSGEVVA